MPATVDPVSSDATRQKQAAAKRRATAVWSELNAVLEGWDPIGCGDDGPPAGEYDCLARLVVGELQRGASLEQLRMRINRALTDHFGVDGEVPREVVVALIDQWRLKAPIASASWPASHCL